MSLRVAFNKLVRLGVRTSTPMSSLVLLRTPPLPSLCLELKRSCSAAIQHTNGCEQLLENPVTELTTQCLLDMGFTDDQAAEIHKTVHNIGGRNVAQKAMSTLSELFVLGLNPSSVVKLLTKCPKLYNIKETQLRQRITNLRKLGLNEGSLQRTVVHFPQLLDVPAKSVNGTVLFLKENCLFTSQQVTNILRDCPAVVVEDQDQLQYKFQYIYFRMGIKQASMVKHKLFQFPFDELRCRHIFLERRGLFQTPDKKGQTTIVNPKLDNIVKVDLNTFLEHVARASAEEYEVFQKLLQRELKDEEWQGKIEAETDTDDYYDEDDEEGEEKEEIHQTISHGERRK